MAFCKYCGKEISEGAVCDCAEAQQEAAKNSTPEQNTESQNQFSNVAQNAQAQLNNAASKVDGLAGDISENLPGNMKGNKKLVLIAGGVVVVLILVLLISLFSGGASSVAKKYTKAMTKKNGGKTILTYTLPDEYIDDLKDDDEWKDKVEDYNDTMEDELDDIKIKIKKIEKKDKLSNKELKGAEGYFDYIYDCEVDVKSGYEFKVKVQTNDDGDKDTETSEICVVKVKGEGWKVIPMSAKSLKGYDD